jgi:hypothetical protein
MNQDLSVVNTTDTTELEAKLNSLFQQIGEGLKQLQQLDGLSNLDELKNLKRLESIDLCLKHLEELAKIKDLDLLGSLSELRQLGNLDRLNKLDKLDELKNLRNLEDLAELARLGELKNLIHLQQLTRLDKINELAKLDVIDRLDVTLTRHNETLRPLKHLDELEKLKYLEQLKSLSSLESLGNLVKLEKLIFLDELNKLENLKSLAALDNLKHLPVLDELKNLDQLKKLQHLEELQKLHELKNLDQLEKLKSLSKLDRIDDARFAERLDKLDKLDILKNESKKLAIQQFVGTGLDIMKVTLAAVIIILVASFQSGQKVISKTLPFIGFSHSAQTSLGLQLLMGHVPDEKFEEVLVNVRKKIDFEVNSLFSLTPLPLPLDRLILIKQLSAYQFSDFGADLSDEIKTKMGARKNALSNQVIEALDFSIGLKKAEGNENAHKVLREVKILIMNGKYMEALELALPYWGSDQGMALSVLISIIEMEKVAPELVERVLSRPLSQKNL